MCTENEIYVCVKAALKEFLEKDKDLLRNDANERSITHKLAEYLQKQFPLLNVDCEYNRRGDKSEESEDWIKRLDMLMGCMRCEKITHSDLEAKTVYPDIIVHKRGRNDKNILVIEVKKSSSREDYSKDEEKLEAFTRKGKYHYSVGLLLVFDVKKQNLKKPVKCFKDGEEHENCIWSNLPDEVNENN